MTVRPDAYYCVSSRVFPKMLLRPKDPMPALPQICRGSNLTGFDEADGVDWFAMRSPGELSVQTLYQQNGYAMTLLVIEDDADSGGDDDDEGLEDTFDRFSRL